MAYDAIDRILDQWGEERPELDTEAMGVLGRIYRISDRAHEVMEGTFARHGLTGGDFDVLAALRRSGKPFQLAPSELSSALMLTSGGMTGRIDRLETGGLVARSAHPTDRRSKLVTLTERGREVIDEATNSAVDTQIMLLAGLSADRRHRLNDLLRELLAAVDSTSRPT